MAHKFKKGDHVGIWSDYLLAFVPATVTSTEKNLVNVVTSGNQRLTADEDDIVLKEALPKPRREVLRISERLR